MLLSLLCDPGREVQTQFEDRNLVTLRHDDVFAITGIKPCNIVRAL
jgi:hypothetical protein